MVSICRLCASLKKTENLTFIRDTNHELCEKLIKCCQLSIDLDDVLPKGVCPECIRSLNTFFEFYERVHESQQSLEKLLNVDSGKIEMVDDEESSKEQNYSLAMMAAAAAFIENDQSPEESLIKANDINEPMTDDDSADVTRVRNEILYSDPDDDITSPEEIPEENAAEMNASHESPLLTGDYAGIEFIDDVEEEIDFEHDHYEFIVEDGGEDEAQMVAPVAYESQDTEDNELLNEECTKVSTSLPTANETWIDYAWRCARCMEVCSSAQQLIEHNQMVHQVHAPDMEWICSDCQKSYPRYYTLINHIRQRHHTHLALLCDICNDRCKSFKDLEHHRRELHKYEKILIVIICGTCGKGFHTTNSLQVHSKCHLPDAQRLRYACNLCDKKFRTSSNLKFHQKMHAGTRDFVCDQCGKKFGQRVNLDEHLITHMSSTPYECSQCNKFFKTSERLTKHKQRHTDSKPYGCTDCDRTFRTKDAMATHMRIHTGEMPYACEFCKKPFRFRSTLTTHHNIHTGSRPYSCIDCDHHFTNWPNYNKHMKRRHGIDVSSRNPRGRRPANPVKPLLKPKQPSTTTTNFIVKREAGQDIRIRNQEEVEYDVAAEYDQEEDINITLPKQEKPDDNYADAI